MQAPPALRVIATLVTAGLACSLTGGGGSPSPEPTPLDGGTPVITALPDTAQETPESVDSFEGEFVEPPPEGFVDSIAEGVAAGRWTYEEGLITALRVLAGELDMGAAFGESVPSNAEATGVLLDARRYILVGTDPQARAEIERLVSLLVPDVDRLIEFSRPEAQSSTRGPGLASPHGDSEACAALYKEGFPQGSSLTCFVLLTTPVGSHLARVLYPESWSQGDPRLAYAHASAQAIVDAYPVFSAYGPMMDIDLVFALLEFTGDDSTAAVVDSLGGEPVCKIVVFPLALTGSEPKFKQVIAHEVFHCFQQWNFPKHFPETNSDTSWSVQDWWGEGTADYFSNVVYPTVNLEWNTVGGFAAASAEKSLVYMSYANSVFFQYYANRQGGPTSVLDLINQLPDGGTEVHHAAALAGVPGIADLFHQFGRDFVDKKIADTAPGMTVPTGFLPVPQKFRIPVGPGDHTVSLLNAPAFTLTRYSLRFAKERLYSVTSEETGSGLYGSRPAIGTGWNPLPATVAAGCGEVPYYVLLTSSDASASQLYTLSVTSDVSQKTQCDPCLFGTWELNKDSFLGYISTPFIETPDLFQPDVPQGSWRYTFTKDGNMGALFDFAFAYRIHQTTPTGAIDTDVLLTIDGPGQAIYWIPEAGQLAMQAVSSGFHMEQTVAMNGEEVASGPVDLFSPFPSSGTASSTYSCSPSKLFLTMAGSQSAGLPALEYDRVP